jgi:hypothetical protein
MKVPLLLRELDLVQDSPLESIEQPEELGPSSKAGVGPSHCFGLDWITLDGEVQALILTKR